MGSNLEGRLGYLPIQSEALGDVVGGKKSQNYYILDIIDYFQQGITIKERNSGVNWAFCKQK